MPHSYYYDQWQQPEQPQAVPAAPPCPARPRRGRKAAVLFACALVLIALVSILAGLAIRKSGPLISLPSQAERPWADLFPWSGLYPETPSLPWADSTPAAVESTPATTVERAPVGDGTTLTIMPPSAAGELSLQAIYQQNIPSIVSVQGDNGSARSLGTGVVLSQDGYIITNAHVIEGCRQVRIVLQDERDFDALLVGMDGESDLAVLKIDAGSLIPAQFGDSDLLQVGDLALAIGNPLGVELRGTMTDGIISAINRDVNVDGRTMVLLQTTAALNSGNSGGALINGQGQVIGITTLKMSSYYDTIEGLGFAIPSTTVKRIVDELIDQGHISGRPTIGITVNTLPVETEDGRLGLRVIEVEQASAAWAGGLRPDDVIVAANGVPVSSMAELEGVKAGLEVGDPLTFQVIRDGRERTIEAALMDRYQLDP